MIIGSAKKEQAEQIARLLGYICDYHADGRPDIFIKGGSKYDAESVARLIDDPDVTVLTAAEGDNVLGYLIAKVTFTGTDPHIKRMKTFYVDDLCVSPEHARTGVGTALFDEARRRAKELGCERIDLNVWAFNEDAIRFYEKMGLSVYRMHMEELL